MVLLRRVIGDVLRARRQAQQRTLREVSTAANVSLGYLSEIERGQKEASSELLGSICDALGAQLSEVLRDVTDTVALSEQMDSVLVPVHQVRGDHETIRTTGRQAIRATTGPVSTHSVIERAAAVPTVTDGQVSVTVRRDSPLKTTLRAKRMLSAHPDSRPSLRSADHDVVCVA